jgi:thiamine biosynthesis protein ThiI
MLDQGLEVIFAHCDSRPFTKNETVDKTKELIKILAKRYKIKPRLYMIPHAPVQSAILEKVDHKVLCVICKRMMYRVVEKIAEKEKAHALVTGENLGQVASQTLDNLVVEDSAIGLPILRPLLGYDKNEIIEIAKKINTYWVSILPGVCCKFVPKYPETHSELKEIEKLEKQIDIKKLVSDAVKNAKEVAL